MRYSVCYRKYQNFNPKQYTQLPLLSFCLRKELSEPLAVEHKGAQGFSCSGMVMFYAHQYLLFFVFVSLRQGFSV